MAGQRNPGVGSKWGGLYLGRLKGKDLYAGKVDHGFDSASAKDLQARLKPLIRKTQPLDAERPPSGGLLFRRMRWFT
jgi:ATP-dependent DNA ligase